MIQNNGGRPHLKVVRVCRGENKLAFDGSGLQVNARGIGDCADNAALCVWIYSILSLKF